LDGKFEIDSAVGKGTRLNITVPLLPEEGSQMDKIRVVIADDHAMVREGLKQILELEKDIAVVAQASNAKRL